MGLETFNYIDSLNASNPVHATDPVSQGDDHLRGIKTVLLNTFPNLDAAVDLTPTEMNYLDGVTGVSGTGNLILSASPTFTGTLTAAAIVATTYDGIAAADLLDKSASEVISGATWDFQAITAVSYGGITEANLVDKSAAETISGAWTFSATLTVDAIQSSGGSLDLGSESITTDNDTADEAGWKGIPHNEQNGNYTLVLADAAKRIYKASGGAGETITIPANASVAFPVGTAIEIINDGGDDLTIAITTDTLEELGTGNTGSRTLQDNGKAIIEKVTSTLWKISGIGLT